ncbi:hypothetical protein [Paraburkholderia sp. J8-2]|uniref:hypothetical protein n=1 Tax=Paraburkholderia sp. J8-2 TaxID=2805440 RepID=UPI002AB76545|nr:hypothetical protein [Paraburkholderia sp. J8-2]
MANNRKGQPLREARLVINSMSLMDGLKQVLKDDLVAGLVPRLEAAFDGEFIDALSLLAPLVINVTDLEMALSDTFAYRGVFQYEVVQELGIALAEMLQGRKYEGSPDALLRDATAKLVTLTAAFISAANRDATEASILEEIARVVKHVESEAAEPA